MGSTLKALVINTEIFSITRNITCTEVNINV